MVLSHTPRLSTAPGAAMFRKLLLAAFLSVAGAGQAMAGEKEDLALWNAVDQEDVAGVKRAIADGANVNSRARFNAPPIHGAANRCNAEILNLLAENGANLNDKAFGETPLESARDKPASMKEKCTAFEKALTAKLN